jgi:myosin V
MEERVQQLIVTAVLEHEAISGLSSHKPVGQGGRARAGSTREPNSPVDPQEAITLLLRELTIFHQTLQLFGVEPTLVAQAFRQVMGFLFISVGIEECFISIGRPSFLCRCSTTFVPVH